MKPDFERSAGKVAPASTPAPTRTISVSTPPRPPHRKVRRRPLRGALNPFPPSIRRRNGAAQRRARRQRGHRPKAAPDALRRSYAQPAGEKMAPAKEPPAGTAAPATTKDYWQQATRPKPDAARARLLEGRGEAEDRTTPPRIPGHDFDRER